LLQAGQELIQRRSATVDALHQRGEVGDPDPFTAAMDALGDRPADEILISTLPATSSGWLKRDLIDRVRDATGLPVEHVVTDINSEGLGFDVTLVIANRTAGNEALVERLLEKNKAAEGNDVFIVVVPLDSGEGNATAAARARLGNLLDRLRSEGRLEAVKEDMAARKAVDIVVDSATPIEPGLEEARKKLWTPGS
jgi:hypothetical protein